MRLRRGLLTAVVFLFCAAAAPADVLYLRDGSRLDGSLTSCDDEVCTVDKRRIPRGMILRIVLAAEPSSPSLTAPGVLLKDGTIRSGTLTDLNIAYVTIGDEEIRRKEIAAIILVPEQAANAPSDRNRPIIRDLTPDTPGTEPPSEPSGPMAAPERPAPSPSPAPVPDLAPPQYGGADEPLPRGRLWMGKLIARLWDSTADPRQTLDVSVDVRLREYTRSILSDPPAGKKIAEIIFLNEEGTAVSNTYASRSQHETCSGEGETVVNHPTRVWSSAIYRRTAGGSMPRLMGFDIARSSPFYMLAIGPYFPPIPTISIRCVGPDGTWNTTRSFIVPMAGTLPTGTVSFDTEIRHLNAGRMIGSYTSAGGTFEHASVSWSVCLEGTACPPPAPLDRERTVPEPGDEPPFDPCARAGQEQSFAGRCSSELDSKVQALEPHFAEYNNIMAAAEANRAAFEQALNYCELYDAAQQLLEAIITGGTGPAAEAARGLLHLRNLIDKALQGDLPSVLYPAEVKKVLDIYKQAKTVWFELTADELAKMQRDINACSGKAPVDTYMRAKQYLEDLRSARRVWETKVAPAINDLRSKGQECANLNHAAWRACLRDAECRGESPNCGPEPELHGAYDEQ